MANNNNTDKLLVKIICLNGIKYEKQAHSAVVNLKDGLMVINKNYAAVIEEIKKGKIKVFENQKKTCSSFDVSDGWMLINNNVCEIFVSTCEKI